MLHKEETSGNHRKWGASTQQVIEAIQNNCTTLREIANYTGIPYRSVNGFIASLENQERVRAEDYGVKRRHQQFFLMTEEEKSGERRSRKAATGSTRPPLPADAIAVRSTPRTVKHAVMQLQSVFGIAMPPPGARTYETRVHRAY